MRKRYLAMLLAFAMLFMNFISAAPAIAGASDMPLRDPELVQGFYFESQAEADEWTLVDADGDGYNWEWCGFGVNYFNLMTGNQAYEGIGMISSASLNSGTPLTPDNWIISPAVALPAGEASLTFYVRARIPSSVGEHFAVYAGTAPEISAMTEICPETEATAEYVQLSADLSDFAGGNVYIAFRNFNSTGINGVAVDQAEIWSLGGSEPVVTPEPTTGPAEPSLAAGFYFESQAEFDAWTLVDADGDGHNWEWCGYGVTYINLYYGNLAYEGMGMISSASMFFDGVNYTTLTPDNWIISPAVALPAGEASLTFYVRAKIPNSLWEHYAVYAGASPEISAMTMIVPESEAKEEYAMITADLSDFAGGNVYIAFRNFNSTGINGVAVDQAEIWSLGGSEPSPTGEPEPTATPEPVMSDLDLALNIEGGTIHFENDAAYPWYTVEEGGRFYAQAGNSGHVQEYENTTSMVRATVTVDEDSVIYFDYLGRGIDPSDYPVIGSDNFSFTVDGTYIFNVHDDMGEEWQSFACELSAGTHVLTWRFHKAWFQEAWEEEPADLYALDNVYIGPLVTADSITVPESIEVALTGYANIEWSVQPDDALYKDVMFTVDDPEIATVDENGRVHGCAIGTTHVTIALVSDPSVYAVTEIRVSDTGLSIRFYGKVGADITGELTGKLISFMTVDPSDVSVVANLEYDYLAAAYAYGRLFGLTESGRFFYADVDDPNHPTWVSEYYPEEISSLAYDYTRSKLFGLSRRGGIYYLVSVDPETGAVSFIDMIGKNLVGCLAVDEAGIGYFLVADGDLYRIDLDTAEWERIGSTGIRALFWQDMCYDFDNGYLYWAQFHDAESNGFYRINKETAEAEYLGKIAGRSLELTGMFTIPENEPAPHTAVTGVYVLPGELTLSVGETKALTAHIIPFTAENTDVVWSVDNEDVVSVDQNGRVTGLSFGTATVTVTTEDGGFTASVTVSVGSLIRGFFFEDEAELSEWTFVDKDGDGLNWIWNLAVTADFPAYEGEGLIFSESWSNELQAVLNPDNWAVSTPVRLPNAEVTVSLYAMGIDYNNPNEQFAIYAGLSPDPDDMVRISEMFTVTSRYVRYDADLSLFAGKTVYIAIRHYMPVGYQYILSIDDVEVWQVGEDLPEPPELPAMGDANGDGVVDFVDALLVLRQALDIMELPEYLYPILDVDGDGSITVADALLILRYAMGLVPSL